MTKTTKTYIYMRNGNDHHETEYLSETTYSADYDADIKDYIIKPYFTNDIQKATRLAGKATATEYLADWVRRGADLNPNELILVPLTIEYKW